MTPEGLPKRHKRSRRKGARLPPGVRCVTRPGPFGNPFDSVEQFRFLLEIVLENKPANRSMRCNSKQYAGMQVIAKRIGELRGKDLACFCDLDQPCHADVLIEFANKPPITQ